MELGKTEQELLQVGAITKGHFSLNSGRCSEYHFDVERLPKRLLDQHVDTLLRRLGLFGPTAPDVLVGLETGGWLVLERLIKMAEDIKKGPVPRIVRLRKDDRGGFRITKVQAKLLAGKNVVVIDDVLTGGRAIRRAITALRNVPANVTKVGVLVDRSSPGIKLPVAHNSVTCLNRCVSAIRLELPTFTPKECPQHKLGIALSPKPEKVQPVLPV